LLGEALARIEMEDERPARALRLFAERIFDVALAPEGIALMRQVIAEATQFPELGQTIFAVGVQVVLGRIKAYLTSQAQKGVLNIDKPETAATIFVELIIQQYRMRLLCGVPVELSAEAKAAHLDEVVALFLKLYGAETKK
jgi:hypothetical protein